MSLCLHGAQDLRVRGVDRRFQRCPVPVRCATFKDEDPRWNLCWAEWHFYQHLATGYYMYFTTYYKIHEHTTHSTHSVFLFSGNWLTSILRVWTCTKSFTSPRIPTANVPAPMTKDEPDSKWFHVIPSDSKSTEFNSLDFFGFSFSMGPNNKIIHPAVLHLNGLLKQVFKFASMWQ